MNHISQQIAQELSVQESQVNAAISLLDEGSTVPFIARYRKEATNGLDDIQLRALAERLVYLRELEDRRAVVLKSIEEQGKMTDDLKKSINAAETKTRLEDLYLPYKPRRRTKAQIAREAGLEPLANDLFTNPGLDPEVEAKSYLNAEEGVEDVVAALEGARQILMEKFSEDADLLQQLREYIWSNGQLESRVFKGKEAEGAKFSDYFEFDEAINKVPSHRALALFRGRNEGILYVNLKLKGEAEMKVHPCVSMLCSHFSLEDKGRASDSWMQETSRLAWRSKISIHVEMELKLRLKEAAESEAINVFANNLKDLLLAAPAGPLATLGLDPGLRTGVKVAVVDSTGKLVDFATIYPHQPKNQWDQSLAQLAKLCEKHSVKLLSIGNGTASRETDKLAKDLIKKYPKLGLNALVVSEAGASVYSASELASKEFPDIDVSIRGAVSIARRLQDPLAELVKIEPKAIGVGQYQHDVNQYHLGKSLDVIIENCVNAVGVDLNMASVPLLTQVSGLSESMAENIVAHRDANGRFLSRESLLEVPRLGPKAYEQAAGFLRIMDGDNLLDRSSVHPEAYSVVENIIKKYEGKVSSLIGNVDFLKSLNADEFISEKFGKPTVIDIIKELEKPGRDPRPEFKTAVFKDGVEAIKDLKEEMILEGVVTNVTNFGAFVDVGVHQDGLVHISALANKFVKDPREVVKAGDIVKVKVMEVDIVRKRIGLSMRLDDDTKEKPQGIKTDKPQTNKKRPAQSKQKAPQANLTMANAFAKVLNK